MSPPAAPRRGPLAPLAVALLAWFGGPARASCPEAAIADLTCSSTVSGHLEGADAGTLGGACASSDCYTCGTPTARRAEAEADDVYTFTCQVTGTVTVQVSGLDCDLDVFVLADTCDPSAGCLAGTTRSSTTTDAVSFACVAGTPYTIVVEGFGFGLPGSDAGACGAGDGGYTLAFGAGAGEGCAEDCDDGLDNDGDAAADCDDDACATDPACDPDVDGDGHDALAFGGDDCDDGDAAVHPAAPETCDGVDEDCDGTADDGAGTTWYLDADGDGHGTRALTRVSCTATAGYAATADDCDDTTASRSPSVPEACDGVDNDCDGAVDDGAGTIAYADTDADGYGDPATGALHCTLPAGYTVDGTDCDDTQRTVYPGAAETCDGLDNDCDGAIDDAAFGAATWYADSDGDGYGDADTSTVACSAPAGWASNAIDCWDEDPTVYPGAPESPDGVDEDCDGRVDDGTDVYDDDGDGFAERGGDCDDDDAHAHPGGTETCDAIDEDCDGLVDEGTACGDADGDGWTGREGDCNDGDATVSPDAGEVPGNGVDDDCDGVIDLPADDPDGDGVTADGGDCGPLDPDIHPGATERANGQDDDCDGAVDEETTASDDDGDGVSEDDGDCDDTSAATRPEATEAIDGVDNNCDGRVDEGTTASDDDGDGFTEEGGDCDDADPARNPTRPEAENGIDEDCDGVVDDGVVDLDADGWTEEQGDCDDQNGWVNPGRREDCDGWDNDCDREIDEDCREIPFEEAPGCGGCGGDSPARSLLIVLLATGAIAARSRTRDAFPVELM